MPSPYTCKECAINIIQKTNPWTWMAILYGLQVLGALSVTRLFDIDPRQTLFPILLLLLGTIVSIILGRYNNSTKTATWKFWIPASIYALFIITLSHKSFPDANVSFDTNLFHPIEYATLGLLFSWGWYPLLHKRGPKFPVLAVLASGVLFAVTDEIHQAFVPRRFPSFLDLSLDFIGLCLGLGLFLAARYIHERAKACCAESI
jgi:VanZ family protein